MFILAHTRNKPSFISPLAAGNIGSFITPSEEIRILCVIISRDYRWSTQSSNVRKSINKMIKVLNLQGTSLNTNTRVCIFIAFISLKQAYCLPVWCSISKTEQQSVDHTIQRALHAIFHKKAV